jgi:hypothetical protein
MLPFSSASWSCGSCRWWWRRLHVVIAYGDGDGSTSWPCLMLALRAGAASWSWCPAPSCLALWMMWAPWHSLPWLRVMSRHAHSHPVSGVWPCARGFASVVVGGSAGPPLGLRPDPRVIVLPQGPAGRSSPSWGRARRGATRSQGVGRVKPVP